MLFSVVVPIYKVGGYLRECIESVLSQSWQDYELILVDDGSPDECPDICDEYAQKDKRIRVIHQENRGLSGARNSGIRAAIGDYIFFLDGDDVMASEALAAIQKDLMDARYPDLLTGNIIHWNGEQEVIRYDNRKYLDMQEERTLLEFIEVPAADYWRLPWEAYHSVFKRGILTENELLFTENLIGAEDCDFWLRFIQKATTYRWTTVIFVKYRTSREGSIMMTPSVPRILGQLKVASSAVEELDIFPHPLIMKRYFAKYFLALLPNIWELQNPKDRKTCADYVNMNKWIFSYVDRTPKKMIKLWILKIFGVYYGSAILRVLNLTVRKAIVSSESYTI